MKRGFSLLLCLALLCAALPAGAATLVGSGESILYSWESATPWATDAQSNPSIVSRALDGDPATCYSYTGWSGLSQDDIPELTFRFYGETIAAVWIRGGNYTSEDTYTGYAFPTRVRLRVHLSSGRYLDYSYVMDDTYDPWSANDDWANGYQRLALPYTLTGVQEIDVFISSWRTGSREKHNVCVSDILFARTAPAPATAVPMMPTPVPVVTPTPWNGGQSTYGRVSTTLTMRLATRSGPSTRYDELGSYFKAGSPVTVLSKAWDSGNRIWWVQVEFSYNGMLRRAYTGLKRVNLDPARVPEEQAIGSARVIRTTTAYYGPGTRYTAHRSAVAYGTVGTVYARENGYVQLEFTDGSRLRRVWIYSGDVTIQ